ncbi:hypothetical protein QBC46DRAFT_423577 [Diplogelasinospora grovesii]|uniref:Alpha/beta hydrolase n=1 Tax=Diplogelasinospora grovesii TaxID=303347 RepID=A0AAN6MZ32_9PEZI|nr:hypothetical protein QBC46DRAFT_423577 [Diplogelasinospora grovesii]
MQTGVPTLRRDYRYPARNRFCAEDVQAAMKFLQDMYALERFVLVGWSFGGAPVDDGERAELMPKGGDLGPPESVQ